MGLKLIETLGHKTRKIPLKKMYYLMLVTLIGLPIMTIFIVTLLILNQQFKQKAIENIRQMQQTLITQLAADVDDMSLRMTSMIYANNYEVMEYAAGTDTDDIQEKEQNRAQLKRIENLYLDPNKEVMSLYFVMKDGSYTYMKNYIAHDRDRFTDTKWYQSAVENPNKVYIGGYDTLANGDLFIGGKQDMLILIGVLKPDINTDSSGKIEMVELYQSSKVADQIKDNNRAYEAGKNRLGITQITDESHNVIFATVEGKEEEWQHGYTCISTQVKIYDNIWYLENYVKTELLTEEFRNISFALLGVMAILFAFITYYSSYFIKRIVKPIESVNYGLREVEDGKLDVHIEPCGQYEIRNMIHQFNAMVRRLRELFQEYETKIATGRNTAFYFQKLMQGQLSPEEVGQENKLFFQDAYVLLGIHVSGTDCETEKLLQSFERQARYASRCTAYVESANRIYLFYRILEKDYEEGLHRMIQELQKTAELELSLKFFTAIGSSSEGASEFDAAQKEICKKMKLRHIFQENGICDRTVFSEETGQYLEEEASKYTALADALFEADEKNVVAEREKLFESFRQCEVEQMRKEAYCVIIAVGERAQQNEDSLLHIFGQQYDYREKLERIMDTRGVRLWLTNFLNWILDYTSSHLEVRENDMVLLAKRYIAEQYENSDLSLSDVASYVGLNEKYFSTRFTKEAGETMSEYLTAVRMQKAKELLKTTNFKVYEIAEMVGYHTLEHFNRVFKKNFQISPSAYRKSGNQDK